MCRACFKNLRIVLSSKLKARSKYKTLEFHTLCAHEITSGNNLLVYHRNLRVKLDCSWSKLDIPNISSLLRACNNAKALLQGKYIHDRIIRSGLQQDVFLGNTLIQMYGKCGALQEARGVFDDLHCRNVFSWNIMIAAYIGKGKLEDAIELFHQMPERNVVTWNALIRGYAQDRRIQEAQKLFEEMPERNVISWTTMISAYAKLGNLERALQCFERMPKRNIVAWNSMLSAYVQQGKLKEALDLFHQMPEHDIISWTTIITAYTQQGKLKEALHFFHQMPHHDTIACTAIIVSCAREGQLEVALQIFQQMDQRDVAAWTAMISAYTQRGQLQGALQLFERMLEEDIRPDKVAFISTLDACARTASLAQGKRLHIRIVARGLESNVIVQNALINMYAKCGSLEDVHQLFTNMNRRDVISWTVLITLHALHGHGKKVLKIMQEMQLEGLIPDPMAFGSILTACSHAGMVDEGCFCFCSLSLDHQISTSLEHYSCITDLLGRAGHLDEADDLVSNMPFKANAQLWTSLFASCRMHASMNRAW